MTQTLQYTPSVYFNFDDTINKTNFSKSNFFELSCTNHKPHLQNPSESPIKIVEIGAVAFSNPYTKLKTDQFFQQFDNNFIVTFDQQPGPITITQFTTNSMINNYSNTINSSSSQNNNWTMIAEPQTSKGTLSNIQHREGNANEQQTNPEKDKLMMNQSFVISKEIMPAKEKNSPLPYFQIKKRTVFKNKQNILNNQQFKQTKKKQILNANVLDIFFDKSKSCVPGRAKQEGHKNDIKSLTSKIQTNQRFTIQNQMGHHLMDNKRTYDNIFIEHKQFRQSFRSITLNNWKRKLQRKTASIDKTIKRQNIFKNKHIAFLR